MVGHFFLHIATRRRDSEVYVPLVQCGVYRHFRQYISYTVVVSFIGGRSRSKYIRIIDSKILFTIYVTGAVVFVNVW
jgi:hypothetical protein